jgi:hypothetical protein
MFYCAKTSFTMSLGENLQWKLYNLIINHFIILKKTLNFETKFCILESVSSVFLHCFLSWKWKVVHNFTCLRFVCYFYIQVKKWNLELHVIKYDNYFIVTHLFTKQVQIYKLSIELKAIDGSLWKSEKFWRYQRPKG